MLSQSRFVSRVCLHRRCFCYAFSIKIYVTFSTVSCAKWQRLRNDTQRVTLLCQQLLESSIEIHFIGERLKRGATALPRIHFKFTVILLLLLPPSWWIEERLFLKPHRVTHLNQQYQMNLMSTLINWTKMSIHKTSTVARFYYLMAAILLNNIDAIMKMSN